MRLGSFRKPGMIATALAAAVLLGSPMATGTVTQSPPLGPSLGPFTANVSDGATIEIGSELQASGTGCVPSSPETTVGLWILDEHDGASAPQSMVASSTPDVNGDWSITGTVGDPLPNRVVQLFAICHGQGLRDTSDTTPYSPISVMGRGRSLGNVAVDGRTITFANPCPPSTGSWTDAVPEVNLYRDGQRMWGLELTWAVKGDTVEVTVPDDTEAGEYSLEVACRMSRAPARSWFYAPVELGVVTELAPITSSSAPPSTSRGRTTATPAKAVSASPRYTG